MENLNIIDNQSVKKKWQKPEVLVIERTGIRSGGHPSGVEGQKTAFASPGYTFNSVYHS